MLVISTHSNHSVAFLIHHFLKIHENFVRVQSNAVSAMTTTIANLWNIALKILLAFLVPFISACSINPLPEDTTGSDTNRIVQKIRCETKDALKGIVYDVITDPRFAGPGNYEVAKEILRDDRILSNKKYYKKLDKMSRTALEKYDGAAIAYDFTFTMTENNDVRGNLNILSNLVRGTDALNLSASSARERKSIVNVRISQVFESLFTKQLGCENFSRVPNYVYPISGEIGMKSILVSFLNLNESSELTSRISDPTSIFAHTLSFTTTLAGSVNPEIVIAPLGKAPSIANAGIFAEAKRSDLHTVIIAISLPPDGNANLVGPGGIPLSDMTRGKTLAQISAEGQIDFQIGKNRALLLVRPDAFGSSIFPF